MKAEDTRFTRLFEGPKQFIVPVFQRDYSWGTKHCLQLWKDIIRAGSNEHVKAHFIGSIVYVAAEDTSATITRWLVIDGQQRLTTVALLLAALRDRLPDGQTPEENDDEDGLPTREELEDYYLRNRHGRGERRYKLHLRRADQDTLMAVLDGGETPKVASERITENLAFFREQLADADLDVAYRGIKKLVAVDVCLTRGQDDPQMIFESLNSTGLDLTQADLIRNFVLMRQDEERQTQLYHDYWQPIESAFGARYRTDFDKFVRDHLTLQLKPSKQLRSDEIYQRFRGYFFDRVKDDQVEDVLSALRRFGSFYIAYIREVVEQKLAQMLARNPKRMDYYKRYQEIIADYNREKDRATVEATFAELVALAERLDAEQRRAAQEGLSEDELALFDLLFKDKVSGTDRERLKQASRTLLASLQEQLRTMPQWTQNTATQAEVEVFIRDSLWQSLPRPPFTDEEAEAAATRIYEFVWQRSASGQGLAA